MADSLTLRWLGQAGFEITAPTGETLLIDPYLSNWCGENTGSQRIVPPPMDANAARPDLVVTTHWHEDHLDPEGIRIIARASPRTVFAGPPSNGVRCLRWGIAAERIKSLSRGDNLECGPFRITAGFARHEVPGFLSEDAVSLSIEVAGRRIHHSGDTEYDSRFRPMGDLGPIDVGLFVINGTGGNMNAREAAFMASELDVRHAIPMHYGMWEPSNYGPTATLDPREFAQCFEAWTGRQAIIMEHGQTIEVP
jgi:L-ascorbate metabolism protein UlaG (beta-lactamase superfamily)